MPADAHDPHDPLTTLAEKLTDFAMALTDEELPLFLDLIDAGGDVQGFAAPQDYSQLMQMMSQMLKQMSESTNVIRNMRA